MKSSGSASLSKALSPKGLSTCSLSLFRYEEEVALKTTAENEFVVLKKVRESPHMGKNEILPVAPLRLAIPVMAARHSRPPTNGGQLVGNARVKGRLIK